MRRLAAALCMTAVSASVAHADAPQSAELKRGYAIWKEASKQYDLGNFEDALKGYEEAYKITSRPEVLNNMGQAERQLHNYERAIFHFKSYLRYVPDATNAATIQQLIIELQKLSAEQKASNEHPPDTVHNPPSTQPVPDAPPVDTHWYQDTIGWSLAGAGLVAIGVGTFCVIHSGSLSDDAETASDQREAQSLLDSSQNFKIAGGVTLAVGGALVIGGIVKMVLHDKGPHPDSKVNIALGLGGLQVGGVF